MRPRWAAPRRLRVAGAAGRQQRVGGGAGRIGGRFSLRARARTRRSGGGGRRRTVRAGNGQQAALGAAQHVSDAILHQLLQLGVRGALRGGGRRSGVAQTPPCGPRASGGPPRVPRGCRGPVATPNTRVRVPGRRPSGASRTWPRPSGRSPAWPLMRQPFRTLQRRGLRREREPLVPAAGRTLALEADCRVTGHDGCVGLLYTARRHGQGTQQGAGTPCCGQTVWRRGSNAHRPARRPDRVDAPFVTNWRPPGLSPHTCRHNTGCPGS